MEQVAGTEIKVALHPLAITTICDHCTRVMVGGTRQPANKPSVGLLFATSSNSSDSTFQNTFGIEITDAVDLPRSEVIEDTTLNLSEVERRCRLLFQVFPQYRLAGWYSSGNVITASHIVEHKKMMKYCENPLFLLVNPNMSSDMNQLPILLFKLSSQSIDSSQSVDVFLELPYILATNKAEEISIDSITKQASANITDRSRLEVHSQSLKTSLGELTRHVDILIDSLQNMVTTGNIDHQVLRMASHLINQLTLTSSSRNNTENHVYTTFLGSSTKSLAEFHHLLDLVALVQTERNSSRGMAM